MKHDFKPLPLLMAMAMALPAMAQTQEVHLGSVEVTGSREPSSVNATVVGAQSIQALRPATSDTASLLRNVPGVSLYGAGGVSSLPSIRGLADDRIRIKVDGMDLIASCPNHMNPALSYLDPSNVGTLTVFAGIAPVSVGGDSIAGTIVAETPRAGVRRARAGHTSPRARSVRIYRSNGNAIGGNVSATFATESLQHHLRGRDGRERQLPGGSRLQDVAGHRPRRTYAPARRGRLDRLQEPQPRAGHRVQGRRPSGRGQGRLPGDSLPAVAEPAHGHARQRPAAAEPALPRDVRLGHAGSARLPRGRRALHGLRRRQALLVRPGFGRSRRAERRALRAGQRDLRRRDADEHREHEHRRRAQGERRSHRARPAARGRRVPALSPRRLVAGVRRRDVAEHVLERQRRQARPHGGLRRVGRAARSALDRRSPACVTSGSRPTPGRCRPTTTASRRRARWCPRSTTATAAHRRQLGRDALARYTPDPSIDVEFGFARKVRSPEPLRALHVDEPRHGDADGQLVRRRQRLHRQPGPRARKGPHGLRHGRLAFRGPEPRAQG